MTDYNETPPASLTSTPATNAIDSMVRASAVGVGGRLPVMSSPDVRVNTGTGEVTILAEPTSPSARIPDGPEVDPAGEINSITSKIEWTQGELARVVYDRQTGSPSPAITGDDRRGLELQLANLQRAHSFAATRAAALFEQRSTDEAERQQSLNEQAARHAFTRGDAGREKALSEALLRAEADEQARAIVASRTRRG